MAVENTPNYDISRINFCFRISQLIYEHNIQDAIGEVDERGEKARAIISD